MEETVKEELEVYKQMICNWRDSYLDLAIEYGPTEEEGYKWAWDEFKRDFTEYMEPKLWRLQECRYITLEEFKEFSEWVGQQIKILREILTTLVVTRRDSK